MRATAQFRMTLAIVCLAPVLLTACEDEPVGPRAGGTLVPGFALAPGSTVSVPEDLTSPEMGNHHVAHSINNLRQVTGWRSASSSSSSSRAYVWNAGSSLDLSTLSQEPYLSSGRDINETGKVAGMASYHAVRWVSADSIEQLAEFIGATSSRAAAITSDGYAVGTMTIGYSHTQPVIWLQSGQYRLLELPLSLGAASLRGSAEDINDEKEIVGQDDNFRAFYYHYDGTPVYAELALLSGTTTNKALGINQAGVIVGKSGDKAVRWPSYTAAPVSLGTLGGSWSEAHDINNSNVIVGAAEDSKGSRRPFRLAPGGYPEALPLPVGAISGLAESINDEGHIAGHAKFPSGELHAVVWWRYTTKRILPAASDWQTRTLSRLAPGMITIALLSVSKQSAASMVDARTLTLGDNVGWDVKVAMNADGKPAVQEIDVNKDGLTDLVVSFDGREVLSKEIRTSTVAELVLKGATRDRGAAIYSVGTITVGR